MTANRRTDFVALRDQAGHTQETLAHALGCSTASVSAWERGRQLPSPRLRRRLAQVLGVPLATINALFGIETEPQLNGHPVPNWLSHYDSLVVSAGHLSKVEKSLVPGLLQTADYASAVERTHPGEPDLDAIAERVKLRLQRQVILRRQQDPVSLTVLLAEVVLREPVGGRAVMGDQCGYLHEMAHRPNIDLRILPADGRAACVVSGFEMLARPGDDEPFMVCTFDIGGANYHERDLNRWTSMWDHLMTVAPSRAESIDMIHHIQESYR